jgi:hypothetical protein
MKPTHLSDAEFVDLLEATLDPARAAHVEVCTACRAQEQNLRALLDDAASIEVPEPSPLFWEHMTARVREAVAADSPRPAWSGLRGLASMATAAALLIAAGAGTLMLRGSRSADMTQPNPASSISGVRDADLTTSIDPDSAAAWEVLTTAASDLEIEDANAAGMTPHAAALDHAVLSLSPAELTELGRLLQTEMKRASD